MNRLAFRSAKHYCFACLFVVLVSLSLSGCSGCRRETAQPVSPPGITDSDPAAKPAEPETVKPEAALPIEQPKPDESLTKKVEIKPEIPKPAPAPKPVAVDVAKPPQEEPKPAKKVEAESTTVSTDSPVNTASPVRTESPVNQTSPVDQNSPVGSGPLGWFRLTVPGGLNGALRISVALVGLLAADDAPLVDTPVVPKTDDSDQEDAPLSESAPVAAPPTVPQSEVQSDDEDKPVSPPIASPAPGGTPSGTPDGIPPKAPEKTPENALESGPTSSNAGPSNNPPHNAMPQDSAAGPATRPDRWEDDRRDGRQEGRPGGYRGGPREDYRRDGRPGEFRDGPREEFRREDRTADSPSGPSDASTPSSASTTTDRTATTPTTGERRLRFNFRYAPWKDVIEWFAEQADLSLQADNVPQGTLNLTDSQYYTPNEALDILNSYLLFKEYTIVRKGKSMFVIYLPDGIPGNLLETITPEELDERGKYELCRCVFNLNRTTPDVIQLEVEKMLGSQGSFVALQKSQQVVITETAGTLRAIRDIIKRIDDPDSMATGAIHIVEMKNLSADEALGIMRKLMGIEETDLSLRTAVDMSGSKVLMSGRGDLVERAKEILKTIDESFASKDVVLEGSLQMEVYDTGIADAPTVLKVLQTLLAGTPDVRLSLDEKTGGIVALGRPANHATIRETIKQMKLNEPTFEVIPLKRLSPLTAVENLRKFIATTTVSSSSSTSSNTTTTGVAPPTVEADVSARQIIVRGTKSQIAEIRSFLEKLGEDGTGRLASDQRTIRTIPLSPAAAALVMDQVKTLWPQLEENEIRVSTPSGMVPMRSTTDLMPKPETPKMEKPSSKPVEPDLDDLIDGTFDKVPAMGAPIGPTTFRSPFSRVRYQTVQHTTIRQIEPADEHQPVYHPIQQDAKTEISEVEDLKREIAELKQQLDILKAIASAAKTALPPANERTTSGQTTPEDVRSAYEEILKQRQTLRSDDVSATKNPAMEKRTIETTPIAASPEIPLKKGAPVVLSTGPNGLMISSEDPEALDRLEEMIRMLSDETVLGKTSLVVYYLKNSTAEIVSQTLQSLMNASNSTTLGVSGSASVDASPQFENEQRAAILGQLSWTGSIEKTGAVSISADSRLNALLVQANPVDHKTIERLLPILDQADPPGGEIAKNSRPRFIQLKNIRAEDALVEIESTFSEYMQSGSSGGAVANNRGNNRGGNNRTQPQAQAMPMMPGMPPGGPAAMLQQMMRMQGNTSSTTKEPEPKMTLSVDSRSNSLIVTSPESLFLLVEEHVMELDNRALSMQPEIFILSPGNVSTDTLRQTLGNVLGGTVKFSTTRSSSSSTGSFGGQRNFGTGGFGGGGFGNQRSGGFGNTGGGGGNNPFLNMMRGGMSGGGGFGGGAMPGGGFGGQQRSGGFGGGQRSGGFGGR